MINYDGWGSPPGRPRRRRGRARTAITVAALCVAVVIALLAGRSLLSSHPTAQPPVTGGPDQPATDMSAGREWTLGACIDPTLSIIPAFAATIRTDLAQAIASLAPPATPIDTSAQPGQPVSPPQAGINLTVREVDTTSYSTNMATYTRNVTVPPVPGLMVSRPRPGSSDYASQLRDWTQDYQTVTAARQTAATDAASASRTIAELPLDRNGSSAISACVSGLLVTVPPGGNHSYLIATDLQENEAPQLHGSFYGASLYVIQACDNGNANYCAGLLTRFTKEMRQLDVGQVVAIRPEDAAQAITSWITTGEATP